MNLINYSIVKYAIIAAISGSGDDNTLKKNLDMSITKIASADDFAKLPVVGNIGVMASENATMI